MKKVKLAAAILGLLSVSQIANSATITNGNFDSGLTGWGTAGNVTLDAGGYAVLNTFLGIDTSAYGGTNGSILSQTVNALAGDVISFSYSFNTDDYLPYNDFALIAGDAQYLVSDVATVGNGDSSGWQNFSFTALSDFSDLKFIASNHTDTAFNSTLFIDNVSSGSVSAVPVPAAVWLFGSGVLGLLGFNRKRSQSLAA
ncbi:hypothetical protein [Methylobacter sp. sgz302048]|uniref:hypothetical protein n=1 Tax=Methylobacter sp. sgz302048 TaxID=3455945 RepID=UPI003FA0C320